jgi:hypothetical protein
MKRLIKHHDIYGMARIGWIPPGDAKGIEVYVHTDDAGKIPHFHVRKYGKNGNFEWETCIRYDKADYFMHGRYKDKLPRGVGAKLDKMLRKKNPKRRGITYWESAVDDWNNNNSDVELSPDIVQPDYSAL